MTLSRTAPPDKLEALIDEVPLVVSVNGEALSVIMVSPFDIEDFVTGFCITERFVERTSELQDFSITRAEDAWQADLQLSGRREYLLQRKRRLMAAPAGCGLCGQALLAEAVPAITPLEPSDIPANIAYGELRDQLAQLQIQAQPSGALHAAMLSSVSDKVYICREDIGRHNAVDKTIGAALRTHVDLASCFMTITSRCGADLVQKAVVAGIPTLISLSSPSKLAVKIARTSNLNLLYLPKNNTPVIFSAR